MNIKIAVLAAAVDLLACGLGEEDWIGPEGGIIATADGMFTLIIPPGALEDDLEVGLHAADAEPARAALPAIAVTPDRHAVARPVTIIFDVEGLEGDLHLVGQRDAHWLPLPDRKLDEESEELSGSLTYFTSVAVLGND